MVEKAEEIFLFRAEDCFAGFGKNGQITGDAKANF